jgi:hypothetical protein
LGLSDEADVVLSYEAFQQLVQPLIGLPVSLPWKGYGSAIFLELGSLAPLESPSQHYNEGEACISVEWDWRVEARSAVAYGSSNSGPKIEAGIQSLRGETVQALTAVGPVPELVVQFSNGDRLRTMVMHAGNPKWSIKLQDGRYIDAKKGYFLVGTGAPSTSAEEKAVFARAERTAARWGAPSVEPKRGSCADCAFFVRLDGEGRLLDYGGCSAEGGPLDGRVVRRNSGCPAFASRASLQI